MNFDVKGKLLSMIERSKAAVAVIYLELDEKGSPCDWVLQYVNASYAKLGGWKQEECIGKRYFADMHPDGKRMWLNVFYQSAYADKDLEFDEYSEEVEIYLHFSVLALHEPGYCFVSMLPLDMRMERRDISDHITDKKWRINSEADIAVLEALCLDYSFADLCDLKKDTMQSVKLSILSHRLTYETEVGEENVSYSGWIRWGFENRVVKEEAPDYVEVLSPENLMRTLDKTRRFSYRHKVHPNDAGHEYFEIQVMKLYADEDSYQVIIGYRSVDDIVAEQKEAKKKLERALVAAEDANRAKSTFLFNMSHDIRTPLNAIIGFSELIDLHIDDPKLVADYLAKIKTSSDYLLSLVNDVLQMARIESGKTELDLSVINVEDIVHSVYCIFVNQMAEKNVEFSCQVDVEHSALWCDPVKIKEVLLNLLSNAFKYTPSGGQVHFTVEEIPSDDPEFALIRSTVKDAGIGMSKAFLDKIFESFTREQTSTESRQNGIGLGMAIAKRLVGIMDGTIEVESEQGIGTTFVVTLPHRIASTAKSKALPIARMNQRALPDGAQAEGLDGGEALDNFGAPDASDASNKDLAHEESSSMANVHILLAEDNDLNAEIAVTLLSSAGFNVDRVADGIECIDKLEQSKPGYYNVILMDIQMPNMDGYKATRIIRTLDDATLAQIPIIAMTANAFTEDKERALEEGMNAHIAKPFNIDEVKEILLQFLA